MGRRSRRGPEFQRGREEFDRGPGPRQIVEELRRENIIGTTQLDTREGSRAVSGEAMQDNSLESRHVRDGFVKDRMLSGVEGDRAVRGAAIQSDALEGRHYSAGSVGDTALAGGAVTTAKIVDGAVGSDKIAGAAVGSPKIADGAVSIAKIGGGVKGGENDGGPPQPDKGVRKIFGTGQAKGAAASDHHHSISFEHLPGTAQDAALLLRERVRAAALKTGEAGDLARAVLFLMHLLLDDYDETGEERRAREKADVSYFWEREAERYWHDSGGGEGMQPKRRFERELHPDLRLNPPTGPGAG